MARLLVDRFIEARVVRSPRARLARLAALTAAVLVFLCSVQEVWAQPRPERSSGGPVFAGCPLIQYRLNTLPGSRRSTDASRFYGECTLDQPVALEASVRQAKKLFFVEEGQVPQNDAQWQRVLNGQIPSVEMRYLPMNQTIVRGGVQSATSPGPYFQVIDHRTSEARSLGGHRFAARTESGQNTEMFGLNYAFYQYAARDIARSYERLMVDAQQNCLANTFFPGPAQTPDQLRLRQMIVMGCIFADDTAAPVLSGLGAARIFGQYAKARRDLLFGVAADGSDSSRALRAAAQQLGIASGDRRTYLARIDELLTHPTFQRMEQEDLYRRLTGRIDTLQSQSGWRNRTAAFLARARLWVEFSEETVGRAAVAEGAAADTAPVVTATMRRFPEMMRYHNLILALRARFLEYGFSNPLVTEQAPGLMNRLRGLRRRLTPGFVTLMGALMITGGVASVLGRGDFSSLPWVGSLISGNNNGDVDVFPGLARAFYRREFVDRYYLKEYFKIAQSVLDLSGRNGCLGGPVELATTDESMMLDQMSLLGEPDLDLRDESNARTARTLTSARSHETITRFVAAGGNCAATSRVSAQVYRCNEAANACVVVRNYRHALEDIVYLFQNYFAAYVENPSTLRLNGDFLTRQP